MKMIEVIGNLKKRGVSITYRKRTDGGYIITSINGTSYKGAKGNAIARNLIGVKLSSGQAKQLKGITEKRLDLEAQITEEMKKHNKAIKESKLRPKYNSYSRLIRGINREGRELVSKAIEGQYELTKTTEELQEQYQKTEDAWKQNPKLKSSRIGTTQTLQRIKREGVAETTRSLRELEKYAKRLATNKTLDAFIGRISILVANNHPEFQKVIDYCQENGGVISDEAIQDAYQLLYQVDNGNLPANEESAELLLNVVKSGTEWNLKKLYDEYNTENKNLDANKLKSLLNAKGKN